MGKKEKGYNAMDMYEPTILKMYPELFTWIAETEQIFLLDTSICAEPMIFYSYDSRTGSVCIKPESNVYLDIITIELELHLDYQAGIMRLDEALSQRFRNNIPLCMKFFLQGIDIGKVLRTFSVRGSDIELFDREGIMRNYTIKQIVDDEG